jgi:hypothetical protein
MRTLRRRALGGLLGIGIVTSIATPALASSDLESFFIPAIAAAVILDATFATYGIAVAGKGELPAAGWSIAETAVTVPQTILCNTIYSAVQHEDEENESLQMLALLPTVGVSILSTHGIWSTATTNVRPGVLAGSSIAVGANVALSTGVLADALGGRFSGRAVGLTTMLLTAPQIAAAGYLGATSPPSSRAGWIGLTAWSGTLFVHGLISTIRGYRGNDREPVEAPPPPPPLPPPSYVPSERPPLLVPASLRVGPTIVSDGVASVPGIGISGSLF